MTDGLWILVMIQMAMGAFDTIYHHEGTERLAWRASQRTELMLHGVRNLLYALLFMALGWAEPHGAWAIALIGLLFVELFITLWDFVEEDRSRLLPATERVTHTLLTLNYGVILALLVPLLLGWAAEPTALPSADHGWLSWVCLAGSVGVVVCGARDLAAARRAARLVEADPASLAAALLDRHTILVTGGTGFIGRRLVASLAAAGHEVIVLTRAPEKAALPAPVRLVASLDELPARCAIDAIVNLAGEPISDSPWTTRKRRRILRTRLTVTRDVLGLAARLERRPEVLVSGSAIGIYGLRGATPLSESDMGTACFSHRLCAAWEAAAAGAENLGIRRVSLRTGLVLAAEGGMLARMLAPFEFGMGGRFGHGRQVMSWIHRDDIVRLIIHAIATPSLAGPVNATAPTPVTNAHFTAALGRSLARPAIMPVPGAPLRWLLGDFAEELLLSGQYVVPKAAIESGFAFAYPTIEAALDTIVGNAPPLLPRTGSEGAVRDFPIAA